MKCPKCESDDKQHKIGKIAAGSQRYRCYLCACKYAPIQKARGYSPEIRQKAVQLYVDGMNLRRIGRHLGVNPQSVANWAKAHAEVLPSAPVPKKVKTLNWMSFSPLSVIKNQNLTPDQCRPGHSLRLRLGNRLGPHSR